MTKTLQAMEAQRSLRRSEGIWMICFGEIKDDEY